MQLGELQEHVEEFDARGVTVVAISVDRPEDSRGMTERMGLSFPVVSDPELKLVGAFALENQEVGAMAIHATYVVSRHGEVIYRKVARRRPQSAEILDALDVHKGTYTGPRVEATTRRPSPWQDWKLVDTVMLVEEAAPLPGDLPHRQRAELDAILEQLLVPHEDPALRLWRAYCVAYLNPTNGDEVLQHGRRLMWKAYLEGVDYAAARDAVWSAGRALEGAEEARAAAVAANVDAAELDALKAALARARRTLSDANTRLGDINQGKLRSLWDLKSMLKAMDELHAAEARRIAATRTGGGADTGR